MEAEAVRGRHRRRNVAQRCREKSLPYTSAEALPQEKVIEERKKDRILYDRADGRE